MRNTFINQLTEEAGKDDRIWLITPDLGFAVLEVFAQAFPERFINVGIAEQNAVGIAAGLALQGKIPYVYSIIPFVTGRCYEQVKLDCSYMNRNVRIVGVGAGYSYGPAGATHHAIDDIAIMRVLPDMGIVAPGCVNEARHFATYSVHHEGPLYIRLAKRGDPDYGYEPVFGKLHQLRQGDGLDLIATSNMLPHAVKAADELAAAGIRASVWSAHTLKPFDAEAIRSMAASGHTIVTLEQHNIIGGLASCVAESLAFGGYSARFLPIAVPDVYSHIIGSEQTICAKMGLSDVSNRILDFFKA